MLTFGGDLGMLLVHCWGDLDMPLVHVWGWSSLVGVILTCRWFTSGLYLDMPSVHCWGWSSLLGVVLICLLFTLVHQWGPGGGGVGGYDRHASNFLHR